MAKCRICKKRLSTNSSKYRHIREVHGQKTICPFCFNFYGRLSQHFLICQKYQYYQMKKLKIIGTEIYFIKETKEAEHF